VAAQGQHGRGGGKFGEGKDSAEQCAAYRASVRPWGGATSIHWLGEQAEARARQGLPGGGRESSNSGELAAWPEQHAKGRATRDPSGVRSSTRLRRKAAVGGVHRGGFYGGRGGSEPVASRVAAAWLHL
jgi:hypothetical protein